MTRLERTVARLELLPLATIEESVSDFYRRCPSGTRSNPLWTPDSYPTGSEKELYPEIGHIVLQAAEATIPTLLRLLGSPAALALVEQSLTGTWRGFRISTVRVARDGDWSTTLCFPGGAGRGGIADIGFFLDPNFEADGRQIRAKAILYLEVKWADRVPHQRSQIEAHLDALARDPGATGGYLGAIGGRPVEIDHPRWLGHVSLEGFFRGMQEVAITGSREAHAEELSRILARRARW